MKNGPPRRKDNSSKPLTRADVARRLRVHTSSVRRWETAGLLHPSVDPNGVHLFDHFEVEQLASTRRPARGEAGELAARTLELFRNGMSLADVVIATRQNVGVVRRLYRLHCGDGDDLMIPATIRRRLEEIIGRRLNAEDLLRVVERLRTRGNGHAEEPRG